MSTKTSYFFQTLAVIFISALVFLFFKEVLPKRIFSESTISSKNVVIDSLLLETIALEEEMKTDEKIIDTFYRKKIVFEQVEGIVYPPEVFSI